MGNLQFLGMHKWRLISAYPTSNDVQDKLIRKISKLTEEGLISICLKVKIRICVFRHHTGAKNGRITHGKSAEPERHRESISSTLSPLLFQH